MEYLEIKPAYNHSKAGMFMFNLCAKGTKFIVKHRGLYYVIACTGGFLMTFIGILITGVLAIAKIFSKTIHFEKYLGIYDIKAGPVYGGGFEMGLMFIRDQKSVMSVNKHEFGHTFQNCLLGPLMPFVVSLPSAIRYGIRELKYERKGIKPDTDYDAIWFEDSASQCGNFAHEYITEHYKNIDK